MALKENHFYHIYNRGINSAIVFKSAKDYQQFLQSYAYYCFLCMDTYAYCLLNNHFHFLVRVRDLSEQEKLFSYYQQQNRERYHGLKFSTFKPQNSSTQWGHLFNSYTRSFNIRNKVTGPLLEGRFKRIEVESQSYRDQLTCYIHRNPIHHHLVKKYEDYRWSSYSVFMGDEKNEFINCKEVFSWFSGIQGFKAAHEEMKLKLDPRYLLE